MITTCKISVSMLLQVFSCPECAKLVFQELNLFPNVTFNQSKRSHDSLNVHVNQFQWSEWPANQISSSKLTSLTGSLKIIVSEIGLNISRQHNLDILLIRWGRWRRIRADGSKLKCVISKIITWVWVDNFDELMVLQL